MAIVVDESHLTKLVHEMTHARARRADHVSERFLTDLRDDGLRPSLLAEIGQQQQNPGKPFL